VSYGKNLCRIRTNLVKRNQHCRKAPTEGNYRSMERDAQGELYLTSGKGDLSNEKSAVRENQIETKARRWPRKCRACRTRAGERSAGRNAWPNLKFFHDMCKKTTPQTRRLDARCGTLDLSLYLMSFGPSGRFQGRRTLLRSLNSQGSIVPRWFQFAGTGIKLLGKEIRAKFHSSFPPFAHCRTFR
jgi:hypothetical protein